jgi:hypothetical protein
MTSRFARACGIRRIQVDEVREAGRASMKA